MQMRWNFEGIIFSVVLEKRRVGSVEDCQTFSLIRAENIWRSRLSLKGILLSDKNFVGWNVIVTTFKVCI